MTFQVESPKITEIQVRMDCNGCVQKIRRALTSVQGIYKAHEDFSQQKIIVVGWADPEIIMKAIKRAGKIGKLCSHTDVEPPKTETPAAEAPPAPETPPEQNNQPAPEQNNAETKPAEEAPPPPPPPAEAPPAETPPAEAPPAEAPPADPKPQENPENPSPPPPQESGAASDPPPVTSETSYYMNSYPRYEYVVRDGYYGYNVGTQDYMMRYNNYPEYVDRQRRYQRDPYYYGNNNGRSSDGFSTVFSDENPNACRIA